MSTILDALRKLQRERAAQSPAGDLRGSITHETPLRRSRRPRRGAGWIVAPVLLVSVCVAGYGLYSGGWLDKLSSQPADEEEDPFAGLEDLDDIEPPQPAPAQAEAAAQAPPAVPDTPEIAAERARLEAALVNARAAQQAQRQAALDEAAQTRAASANPPPQPPAASTASPPPAPRARPVAVAPEAAAPKAAATKAEAKPRPATPPVVPRSPPPAAERVETQSAFPDVQVLSIRWHPNAERRVASLRFERQNVPEAREGDIVAGVLVYRIDPGAVELRVGSAHRAVSPGP